MAYNFSKLVPAHGSWAVVEFKNPSNLNQTLYALLDNTSVTANVVTRDVDVTHSGSGGFVHQLAQLKSVEEITVECDYDELADLETTLLALGANCTLHVKKGTLNKYDIYADCKFVGFTDTKNNQDGSAIKRTYRWKGGSFALKQDPAAGVVSYLAALSPARPYA